MELNANSNSIPATPYVLAIDIGGTAIKYALCDFNAQLSHKGQVPTPYGPEVTVHDLVAVIKEIYTKEQACAEQEAGKIEGIAMALPGVTANGFMRTGGHLFYNENQPLADLIEQAVGLRPVIENDGKAAAEAELWIGALKGVQAGAVLILGTGLGGGLVLNGKVYQGPRGAAGELSNFNVRSRLATLEKKNDTASSISTTGLLVRACEALGLEYEIDDKTHKFFIPIDGRKVFELLEQGDSRVQQAITDFGLDMGFLIYNLCVVLDLEKVAIGGGISAQPALIEAIKRGVQEAWDNNHIMQTQELITRPEITVCAFQSDANLIGAMHHYLVAHELI